MVDVSVVDVSEVDTIGLAPTWKKDVLNHAQITVENSENGNGIEEENFREQTIPVLLLGNKADKVWEFQFLKNIFQEHLS